jgi:hypothetical protein
MKINLEIEYNSGDKVEVICSAPDIVKFEDHFNIAISNAARDMRLTHLLFLAHASLTRTKQTDLDFDAWTQSVDGVGAVDAPKSKG